MNWLNCFLGRKEAFEDAIWWTVGQTEWLTVLGEVNRTLRSYWEFNLGKLDIKTVVSERQES